MGIRPSFAEPVADAQVTFRAVLRAFAEPATAQRVDTELPDLGIPLAAHAILLALADGDVDVWLSSDVDSSVAEYLRFHTGARVVDQPGKAAFAFISSPTVLPALAQFAPGTPYEPERSATVIIGVRSLVRGCPALLDGPGFVQPRTLAPAGFDAHRWRQIRANSERFPAGVDLLLVSGPWVVAIPRSTRVLSIGTGLTERQD